MEDFRLLIDGQLVTGDRMGDVINPADETVLACYPIASQAQLDQAVAAATRAFPQWAALGQPERRAVLLAIAENIEANAGDLARLIAQEVGKTIAFAEFEAMSTSAMFRLFAETSLKSTIVEDSNTRRIEVQRRPLGVVAAIVPWNFPTYSAAIKVAPALITGNTVILKPAPTTPLSTLMIGALIAEVVPKGVVNVLADANDLGDAITAHPDIAKITFTGSTPVGKRIYSRSADNIKRLTLELGGNDAAIVLDDVDPAVVAPALLMSAFVNNAQACVATKRLYVQDAVYDAMCDQMAALAQAMVVGDPFDPATQLGPLQNANQFARAKDYLADAHQHGKVIAGGSIIDRPGYYIQPTIVRDILEGSRLVDEEQFSPILPIIRFTDVDDVVRRANDTPFGLAASVWSSDSERAEAVAARIDAGMVWVNHHMDTHPSMPFGGAKQSGLGMEMGGIEGILEFTQYRVVNSAKRAAA